MLFREVYSKNKKEGGGEYYEWESRGDTVTGELAEIRQEKGNYGIKNVYSIVSSNGTTYDIRGGSVLDNKITQELVGKIIQIEFLGQETSSKNGNSYNNFKVSVGYDE